MNNVDRYISQIGKRMKCPREAKTKVLREYRKSIEYNDISNLSLPELYEKFDSPRYAAENLMTLVSESGLKKYKLRRTVFILTSGIIIATILGLGCIIIFNSQSRVVYEENPSKITLIGEKENLTND